MKDTAIVKRSVIVAGRKTSVSLEDAFWKGLREIAGGKGSTIAAIVTELEAAKTGNLSSAIRLYVLEHVKSRAMHAENAAAAGASV